MLDTHLATHFCQRSASIEAWFAAAFQRTLPPVYGSVDLRYAGFKIAPIDMNLFPAGFNNLNRDHLLQSITASRKSLLHHVPHLKNILLIPESHTRNSFYWRNIKVLCHILEKSNFTVRLGALPDATELVPHVTVSGDETMPVQLIQRENNQLKLADFVPDAILLNNDLAAGVPPILKGITQPILPPVQLGWGERFKSTHFEVYQQVASLFAKEVELDPWFISPLFTYCEPVDFMQQAGMDDLIERARVLLEAIKKKYEEYKIQQQPFLIIKADQGTYGMAVMTVRDLDSLKQLNRKKRTQMSTTKGSRPVNRVIIQEGIYTFETIGTFEAVAEPVVYLFGEQVVGGFYRVHQARGVDENLNSPGMQFEPLPFSPSCADEARVYLYGVIARLSMLAAAQEVAALSAGEKSL
jgi:glutamate--cysteine ligase